jgi:predicted amidohydrolase
MLHVAAIQLQSGPDIAQNVAVCSDLVRTAAQQGASLIVTPEVTDRVVPPEQGIVADTYLEADHPAIPSFSNLAAELGIWLLIGSMTVRLPDDERAANRSYLFGPSGQIVARYDKLHLFDVDLPTGESHRESAARAAGQNAVLAVCPDFKLGMSICYDIRFAYLYRDLAKAGAQIMAVPAAFTVPTGQAHWHVLLRARAIETGSFVIAPAQAGLHQGGRRTFGHSLIINPWGEIIAQGGADGPEILYADLDLSAVARARAAIPALQHDTDYTLEVFLADEKR